MNQERYEIRGKIGQGGVGAVYRAYDTTLRREVAIKRVLADGGYESDEEGTRQLLKEATALSSVQHPHIVTVYDSGIDSDGPYVIMELISGRTLDEMVERGTLTWSDFREVALQTQEALIAAQDLDLVHRDLKPSNVMVSWLPSGKFQVKIVDFGLAKFSAKPSLQTIDHGDSVFGSIFFMAPEQFERTPLDQRTDMYAMGCLYYFVLTGNYPFNGGTAPEVMSAHLQHTVQDLTEARPDIPLWAANWVMWHMSRDMDDRPFNAREALQQFLLGTEGTFPGAQGTAKQKAAKLNFSGTDAQPTLPRGTSAISNATAPQPLTPPDGQSPSLHTGTQRVLTETSSQAFSVQTNSQPISAQTGTQQVATQTTGQIGIENSLAGLQQTGRQGLKKKVLVGIVVAAVLLAIGTIMYVLSGNSEGKRLQEIANLAAAEGSTPITTSKDDVDLLLNKLGTVTDSSERPTLYKALILAKSSDGTDISSYIFDTVKSSQLSSSIKSDLLETVLGQRKDNPINKKLLNFAKDTSESTLGLASIKAAAGTGTPDDLETFLNILLDHSNSNIRKAAEGAVASISKKIGDKKVLANLLVRKFRNAKNEGQKQSIIRMLGYTGGETSKEIVRQAFSSKDEKTILAGIGAVRNWPTDELFNTMLEELGHIESRFVRDKAFSSAIEFLRLKRERPDAVSQSMWRSLLAEAQSSREKIKLIGALGKISRPWAFDMIKNYELDADPDVKYQAERTREFIEKRNERLKNLDN